MVKLLIGFTAILHLVLYEIQGFDYCQLEETNHILCEPFNLFPPPNCKQAEEQVALQKYVQKQLLNGHNTMRLQLTKGTVSSHYPQASYLRKLKWDPLLAISAQNAANTCEDKFIDDDMKQLRSNTYGEEKIIPSELFYIKDAWDGKSYKLKIEHLIREALFRVAYPKEGYQLGNLSYDERVIWASTYAKTYLIGCAERFWTPHNGVMKTKVVCHYYPSGLVPNTPLYPIPSTLQETGFKCRMKRGTALCIDELPQLNDGYYPEGINDERPSTEKSKTTSTTTTATAENEETDYIYICSGSSRFHIFAFFVFFNNVFLLMIK